MEPPFHLCPRRSGKPMGPTFLPLLCLLPVLVHAADDLRRPTRDGYAVPQPGRLFQFPKDHGSHPEFRIEWWYVTGHLWDNASNRFGFQSTFFRTAGPPSTSPPSDGSAHTGSLFGTDQLFLSHIALLDVGTGQFRHQERLNREGWAAGAEISTLHVWNGGASLELLSTPTHEPTIPGSLSPRSEAEAGEGGSAHAEPGEGSPPRFMDHAHGASATPASHESPRLRLRSGIRAEAAWDLELTPSKPLVIFGTNSVSRKGASPTAASHYLTFPRLRVEGRLDLGGASRSVQGIAWMDHEFSSSQLSADQAGWDWLSVQLHDGRELMAYRLRHKNGSTDPFSTLAWIDRDGRVTHQPATAFTLEPRSQWKSPRSSAVYPLGLTLRARDPDHGEPVRLDLIPLAADQELPGTIGDVPYWEGACRVVDGAGKEVGVAFIELTGYAGDLSSRLR